MSLISFILSSVTLSCLGLGGYFVLRLLTRSFQVRRWFLWFIIGSSLSLPFLPLLNGDTGPPTTPVAKSVEDFCHCEAPGAGEMIHYQASRINDLLLEYRVWIFSFFAVLLAAILSRFFITMLRMIRLSRRHSAGEVEIDGTRVGLIRDFPGVKAGAVWLGRPFLLWNSGLDDLAMQDRHSVMLHELSHIRQWNSLEHFTLAVLQALWFFNPAFYFIRREIARLSEFTADAFVVSKTGRAKEYAQLLVKAKTGHLSGLISFFHAGALKERVKMVLNPPDSRENKNLALVTAAFAFLLPLEITASSVIDNKMKEIAVYELISDVNHQTGMEDFCKKCAFEQADACY